MAMRTQAGEAFMEWGLFLRRVGEYRLSVYQSHSRFLLDQKPIRWGDEVWLWWHADDGYMLAQYREDDEDLLMQPPETIAG